MYPFPGRISKQQRSVSPRVNRLVFGIQSLPGPTLWRQANTEKAAAKGTQRIWLHAQTPPPQPLAFGAGPSSSRAPSRTHYNEIQGEGCEAILPGPEKHRALLEAMLNPLQHPGTFIREATEPIEAAFTGDCAVRLPSQRGTKPNRTGSELASRAHSGQRPGQAFCDRAGWPPSLPIHRLLWRRKPQF